MNRWNRFFIKVFFERSDRQQMDLIPKMNGEELLNYDFYFHDPRVLPLLFIYRARNYFETLFEDEKEDWKRYLSMKREYYKHKYQPKYETLLKSAIEAQDSNKISLLESIKSEYL